MRRRKPTRQRPAGTASGRQPTPALGGTPGPTPVCSRRITLACLAAVVVATAMSFAPAIDNEFLYWDDENNLINNTHIRDFSSENLAWMCEATLLGVWQPLTWMITALEYRLFGSGGDLAAFSRGMHISSIALHGVAAILMFFLARSLIAIASPRRATESPVGLCLGATFAALVFAVHPFRVETTAWASGQAYILAMVPALGAVLCYLRAQRNRRRFWHGMALVCLALSLLCKAMAVPLVAALLVLDVYPLRRFGGRAGWSLPTIARILLEKVPYIVLTLVCAGMTIWATWSTKDYNPDTALTKLLLIGFSTMSYAALTFVPYDLAPYYMKPQLNLPEPWMVCIALCAYAITAGVLLLKKRVPWLAAAWVSYTLVLLPNSGLIKHGGQLAADRYSYLSCVGWAILVGGLLLWVRSGPASRNRSLRRAVSLGVAGAIVVSLVTLTRDYCRDWRDSVSVWSAMVERNPKFWMGYYNLAKAHKRPVPALLKQAKQAQQDGEHDVAALLREDAAQRLRDAEADYREAIRLRPGYPEANVDLGNMIKDGRIPGGPMEAEKCYLAALKGQPGFYMAHLNMGYLRMKQRRYAEAVEQLELAIAGAEKAKDTARLPGIRRALELSRRQSRTAAN